MIVLVNPHAGSDKARARWDALEPHFRRTFGDVPVVYTTGSEDIQQAVRAAARSEDPRIVVAGGDGTANEVVNALMHLKPALRDRCTLGAIGLGSSNDFHKPFKSAETLDGVPTRLAFQTAEPCDVGLVRYSSDTTVSRRFFFLNASAGITAEGNARFNSPGPLLKILKRTHVPLAILYAAFTSLFTYKDIPVRLNVAGAGSLFTSMTNLGILKSPYFSGDLRYDASRNYSNGRFVVVACSGMDIRHRLSLFRALKNGSLSGLQMVRSWSTPAVEIESPASFLLEMDGETVQAHWARFTVVPRILKVCP